MNAQQYHDLIQNSFLPLLYSLEYRNQYTQSADRVWVDEGYSDCSSLVWWLFGTVFRCDVGEDTAAQIRSPLLAQVPVRIREGVPSDVGLCPGDLLYFRDSDPGRKKYGYVGHVEIYVGNGELSGHGEGLGPTRKTMTEYCRKRFLSLAPSPIGNRGLMGCRRLRYDRLPVTPDYDLSHVPEARPSGPGPRRSW